MSTFPTPRSSLILTKRTFAETAQRLWVASALDAPCDARAPLLSLRLLDRDQDLVHAAVLHDRDVVPRPRYETAMTSMTSPSRRVESASKAPSAMSGETQY